MRPQVNGVILKRLFKEGELVATGQQLYQIDPAPYQATLASARATLALRRRAALKWPRRAATGPPPARTTLPWGPRGPFCNKRPRPPARAPNWID